MERKNRWEKQKTASKIVGLNSNISIIAFKLNYLTSSLNKRPKCAGQK